jgi:hypothetical protein
MKPVGRLAEAPGIALAPRVRGQPSPRPCGTPVGRTSPSATNWLDQRRLERETDLVAAHVLSTGVVPPAQFKGRSKLRAGSGTRSIQSLASGGTSRPSSVRSAFTSLSNSRSNLALSCSQPVKSAARRSLITDAFPLCHSNR